MDVSLVRIKCFSAERVGEVFFLKTANAQVRDGRSSHWLNIEWEIMAAPSFVEDPFVLVCRDAPSGAGPYMYGAFVMVLSMG